MMKVQMFSKLVVVALLNFVAVEALHAYDNCVRNAGVTAVACLEGAARLCQSGCDIAKRSCRTACAAGGYGCSGIKSTCKGACSASLWCCKKKRKRCKSGCESAYDRCMRSGINKCYNGCSDAHETCVQKGASQCIQACYAKLQTDWDFCNSFADPSPSSDKKNRMREQHHIADDVALFEGTLIGTHNSFNNQADKYPMPNQAKDIKGQLNYGLRLLNFDLHEKNGDVIMCHDSVAGGMLCSERDRKWKKSLEDVTDWLQESGNEREFVVILLEDNVDNKRSEAIEAIKNTLGNLVYTPTDMDSNFDGSTCKQFPIADPSMTKKMMMDNGKQVLIAVTTDVSCDSSQDWRKLIWRIEARGLGDGSSLSRNSEYMDDSKLKMVYEELAIVGSAVDGNFIDYGEASTVNEKGVNLVGLDFPTKIDRFDKLIWSWDSNEPSSNGCTIMKKNGKWETGSCTDSKRFACRNSNNGSWDVTTVAGPFSSGQAQCEADLGSQWSFDKPTNGNYNFQVKEARGTDDASIYVNYQVSGVRRHLREHKP